MSVYDYYSVIASSVNLQVPSQADLVARGAEDSERDGGYYEFAERDCGKCVETGNSNSVMVLNSRDAMAPGCPNRASPDTNLKRAIKSNDLEVVRQYAHEDPSCMTRGDCNGCTPFHYACWHDCAEIVMFLSTFLSSLSLMVTDKQGWSALHYACDAIKPSTKIVQHLWEKGFNPRQETTKGSTPASLASYRGSTHHGIVRFLTDIMCKLSPLEPEDQRPTLVLPGEQICDSTTTSDHPNGDRNMSKLANRLFTFQMSSTTSWKRARPTGRQLAEQGFVYTGIEERVFCFCCKAVVHYWDDGVDPLLKHYDISPQCLFLDNFRDSLSKLLAQRGIHRYNPEYASSSARLHSFSTWSYTEIVTGYKLTSAGFFYTGVGMRTQCFSCGLVYDQWRRGDIPLEVHKTRSPNCEYVQSIEPAESLPQTSQMSIVPSSHPSFYTPLKYTNTQSTHFAAPSGTTMSKLPPASSFYPPPTIQPPSAPIPTLYPPPTIQPQPRPVYSTTAKLPPPHTLAHAKDLAPVKQPSYESIENRIRSFKHLPKGFPVSGEDCAKAGLYFIRKPDVMQCFTCEAIVRGWVQGDVPAEKHRAISPQCKFLREYFPTKLDSKGASSTYSVDPSSLPEPEYTKEDLEKMCDAPIDLSTLTVNQPAPSLYTPSHLPHPLHITPQESQSSGYASNPSYTQPSYDSNNFSTLSTFTPPVTKHASYEPPGKSLKQRSKKLSLPQVLGEERQCVVCMDNDLEVVLLPCGHLCMCQECAANVDQCPMCRQRVENTVRAYLP